MYETPSISISRKSADVDVDTKRANTTHTDTTKCADTTNADTNTDTLRNP